MEELLSRRPRIRHLNGYHYYCLMNADRVEKEMSSDGSKRNRYNRRQKILGKQWHALPKEIQNSHYGVFMDYHRELIEYIRELEEALKNRKPGPQSSSSDELRQTPPTPSLAPRISRPPKRLSPTFEPQHPKKKKRKRCRRQQVLFPPDDSMPTQKEKQVLQDLFPSIFESCSEPMPESAISAATEVLICPSPQERLRCYETTQDLDMMDKFNGF